MDATIKRLAGVGILLVVTACGSGGQTQDPLVEGFPIAYVKRSIPVDAEGILTYPDVRDPAAFNAGADLFIRDHASSQANERNITQIITHDLGEEGTSTESFGDVKDVEASYDGSRLLFAMRKPEIPDADPEDQPTWNIWEYHIPSQRLKRIIELDAFAEEGQDVAPYYLPDGRIIFSSSRQHRSKEVLTDEGKPAYTARVDSEDDVQAMMLHVMESDGSEIKQLTFSPKRDIDPMVRSDGKIIFSRWDRHRLGKNEINLYSINPDGSDLQLSYGPNSHATGTDNADIQFMQPREFHDGRLLTIVRPFLATFGGGDMVLIDADYFVDYGQPNKDNQGLPGTGQESLTGGRVSTIPGPSQGGRYASVYPLADGSNRSLVSWTQCRVVINDQIVSCTQTENFNGEQEAAPFYGLFVHDHSNNTQLPIIAPRENVMITDVVATQERPYPPVIEDTLGDGKTGILHIRSVYDFDGTFDPLGAMVRVPSIPCSNIPLTNSVDFGLDERTPNSPQELADYGVIGSSSARFLRLVRPMTTPGPDDIANNTLAIASGSSNRGRHGFVDIIGYAPIEPDGSVKVTVPADVPFSIQILDGNGRRINIPNAQDNTAPRHVTWLQVKSGETMTCNGCHIRDSQVSHGNNKAVATLNTGADSARSYTCMEDNMLAGYGETMAETRTRICESSDCAGIEPNMNLVYDDLWTKTIESLDSVNIFSKGSSMSLLYGDVYNLGSDLIPTRQACVNSWSPNCRVTINYIDHIAPLWNRPGRLNAGGEPANCSQNGCHTPIAADGVMVQVPAPANGSQINLNDSVQSIVLDPLDGQNRVKSYRELFSRDVQQIDDAGAALLDVQREVLVERVDENGDLVIDPDTGLPFIDIVPVDVPTVDGPPMSTNGANASPRFFNELENDSSVPVLPVPPDPNNEFDHTGALSPAELKLISEWLDGGGQYYNNPFVVP